MSAVKPVSLVNPIPRTLAHYQIETIETLGRIGADVSVRTSPSIEGVRRAAAVRTLRAHLALPRRSAQDASQTLVLWPALGLLEPRVWSRSAVSTRIVVHDPEPLRSQVGFNSLARLIARGTRSSVRLVSHSAEATRVLRRRFPRLAIDEVRHPITSEQRHHEKVHGRVLVAGQFKPVRDLDLLAELGPLLRAAGREPRIVGSGWPSIDGWIVDNRFLSEKELDEELGSADILVLPYRKYFQSGIALRALENGTPTLGTRTSFLESIAGVDSPRILEPGAPAAAWLEAAAMDPIEEDLFAAYQDECDEQWRAVFATADELEATGR